MHTSKSESIMLAIVSHNNLLGSLILSDCSCLNAYNNIVTHPDNPDTLQSKPTKLGKSSLHS